MATDKEVEENTLPNFEASRGTHQVRELEMTNSEDMSERVELPQQPLWRSSRVWKKNPKYAN